MAVSFIGGGNFQQYFSYIVTVSFIGGGNHHNISVISWWSVLLVEETVVQYFSYIVVVSFIGGGNRSNNISVISWQSVLLVEETGLLKENHQPVASH